jgi:fructose-bisphosphate aldolase, class I
VILKLTLPSEDGFYRDLIDYPKVLRVLALSGGYSRDEANALLARNPGMIASFSRALTEGVYAQQADRSRGRGHASTTETQSWSLRVQAHGTRVI